MDPDLTRALKALADPGRLKVLGLLGRRSIYRSELVKALGLAQPTVQHRLAQPRTGGLVRQERAREGMRYTVRREAAQASIAALDRLLAGTE